MKKKNILIIFYSRDGRTKKVAEKLTKKLNCDIEELIDKKKRRGFFKYIIAGRDALKRKLTHIKTVKSEPSEYDLIIAGTPVWAGTLAPATRTFLEQFTYKKVAFFAVSGSPNPQKIFEKMEQSAEKKPVATLHFCTKEVKKEEIEHKINEFIKEIKKIDFLE